MFKRSTGNCRSDGPILLRKCLDSFQLSLSVPELHLLMSLMLLHCVCVCACVRTYVTICVPASCKWLGVFWLLQTYGLNIKVGNILGDNWVPLCRNHGNLLLSVWQKQTVAVKRSNAGYIHWHGDHQKSASAPTFLMSRHYKPLQTWVS